MQLRTCSTQIFNTGIDKTVCVRAIFHEPAGHILAVARSRSQDGWLNRLFERRDVAVVLAIGLFQLWHLTSPCRMAALVSLQTFGHLFGSVDSADTFEFFEVGLHDSL